MMGDEGGCSEDEGFVPDEKERYELTIKDPRVDHYHDAIRKIYKMVADGEIAET